MPFTLLGYWTGLVTTVYAWWQSQLCDIFIQVIKPYFFRQICKGLCTVGVFGYRVKTAPSVYAVCYWRLPSPKNHTREESIMICEYPSVVKSWTNDEIEFEMEIVESAVKSFRSIRGETKEKRAGFVVSRTDKIADLLRRLEMEVSTLANLSSLKVLAQNDPAPVGCTVAVVNEALSVYLKNQGAIDVNKEREKLNAKFTELQKQKDSLNKATSAKEYEEKVPAHIKKENVDKLASLMQQLLSIEEATQHIERQVAMNSET